MAKVKRRKKAVPIDGAEYIVSPLTYNEIEEHDALVSAFQASKAGMQPELRRKAQRDIAFFGVCCGLNNADDDITQARFEVEHGRMTKEQYEEKIKPLEITPATLAANMDDVLCGRLWREIFEFTGIHVPSEEEVKQMQEKEAGETQASS